MFSKSSGLSAKNNILKRQTSFVSFKHEQTSIKKNKMVALFKTDTIHKPIDRILFKDIYLNIKQRTKTEFIAKTADIGLENNDLELKNINLTIPFQIPELQNLSNAIDSLVKEAKGEMTLKPFEKIKFLMKVFNGEIYYRKTKNEDMWKVSLTFKTLESMGYF
jgi:hypothetical protein